MQNPVFSVPSTHSYSTDAVRRRNTLPVIQTTNLPWVPTPISSAPTYSFHDNLLPDLPSNPETWTSAHVARYLSHRLKLTPKPIVEDLTKFIKEDARLNGKKFLNITEADLISMHFQESWRKAIMTGIKMLRRESRHMDLMQEIDEDDTSTFETVTTSSRMGSEYAPSTTTSITTADLADQLADLRRDLTQVKSTLSETISQKGEAPAESTGFLGDIFGKEWPNVSTGFVEGLAVGAMVMLLGVKLVK